ncbi:ferredoxin [Skeletonema marinoi]|uniref:Ferredoxin n=1 Tax=Skeletonema marinoi TaxID=267567 RepID=A0AAD8YIZ7_9STRA|nr:ferredoxin [Skeletonema marinoi]
MFTKVISLTLLAVSAQGFAPIAPNSAATRPKTSLAFTVTIVKDGAENQTIECAPNTYILDAAELQGVQTPYSCRAGACSSSILDDDKLDKGWLLSCVAYPKSDCTIKIDCEDEFYQS